MKHTKKLLLTLSLATAFAAVRFTAAPEPPARATYRPAAATVDRALPRTLSGLQPAAATPQAGPACARIRPSTEDLVEKAEHGRAETRFELAMLIRTSPEAARDALALLRSPSCDRRRASILLGALGASNAPHAQMVLGELLEERRLIFPALCTVAQIQDPIDEFDAILAAMDPNEAPAALGVLGAIGNRIHETDPARSSRIEQHLEIRLSMSHDFAERVASLAALGNLGPRVVSADLHRAIEDEDPRIRMAAMDALRLARTPEAGTLLRAAALHDDFHVVRRAALDALVRRHVAHPDEKPGGLSVRALARRMATGDADETVRSFAAHALKLLGPST